MAARGRPKKQEHEKRSARIPSIDVTVAERAHVEEAANEAGMSLSEFGRNRILASPFDLDLSDADRELISEQAAAAKLSVPEYCRQRLVSRRAVIRNTQLEASVISELSRIGNNLNQVARSLNRGRDADPHHIDHIMGQLHTALEGLARRYGS